MRYVFDLGCDFFFSKFNLGILKIRALKRIIKRLIFLLLSPILKSNVAAEAELNYGISGMKLKEK